MSTPQKKSTVNKKTRYSDEIKHAVISLYPLCQDGIDKEELAERLGIGSLHKLYNLASRLGVTKDYYKCYNSQGEWNISGAYIPRQDTRAWRERQNFKDTVFTAKDDDYLRRYFGKQHIEEIRYVRGHTETAILYRARHLGKRKAAHMWDFERVLAWLSINRTEFMAMSRKLNLTVYPCANRQGDTAVELVSTQDIASLLLYKGLWKHLLQKLRADEFFIREILESKVLLDEDANHCAILKEEWIPVGAEMFRQQAIKRAESAHASWQAALEELPAESKKETEKQKKKREEQQSIVNNKYEAYLQAQKDTEQDFVQVAYDRFDMTYIEAGRRVEASHWVSHGRTCLNPLDEHSFDWFYEGEPKKRVRDRKLLGYHYHPRDLDPKTIYHLR